MATSPSLGPGHDEPAHLAADDLLPAGHARLARIAAALARADTPALRAALAERKLPARTTKELLRFLTLKALHSDTDDGKFAAPPTIDEAWKALLSFPREYLAICNEALDDLPADERVLDRKPIGEDEGRGERYAAAKEAYARSFGEEGPADIWRLPVASTPIDDDSSSEKDDAASDSSFEAGLWVMTAEYHSGQGCGATHVVRVFTSCRAAKVAMRAMMQENHHSSELVPDVYHYAFRGEDEFGAEAAEAINALLNGDQGAEKRFKFENDVWSERWNADGTGSVDVDGCTEDYGASSSMTYTIKRAVVEDEIVKRPKLVDPPSEDEWDFEEEEPDVAKQDFGEGLNAEALAMEMA